MKPRLSREHRTLENSQLTMNNEQRTTNKAMYYINRITTGEPVSTNALTPTHTHTPRRQRDGASAGRTRASHNARAVSQVCGKRKTDKRERENNLSSFWPPWLRRLQLLKKGRRRRRRIERKVANPRRNTLLK